MIVPFDHAHGGLVAKKRVEPLRHAQRIVLLIRRPREPVILAYVLEQHYILAQVAQVIVVRDALIEVHRAIAIVREQHERNGEVLRELLR